MQWQPHCWLQLLTLQSYDVAEWGLMLITADGERYEIQAHLCCSWVGVLGSRVKGRNSIHAQQEQEREGCLAAHMAAIVGLVPCSTGPALEHLCCLQASTRA